VTLLPKGTPGDIVRGLPISVLQAADVKRAIGAWPPKIAAKILDSAEHAAEERRVSETIEQQKAANETAAKVAVAKAAKRDHDKPARVARGGKE
jgi:hypothetical protein